VGFLKTMTVCRHPTTMNGAPVHSILSAKKNNAFMHITELMTIVLQINDRSFFISIVPRSRSMMADCHTAREALLSMHNILLFCEVDTIYFVNTGATDMATTMHQLYERYSIPTWFWGIERPGSLMFECREIAVSDDAMSDFVMKCHHYEPVNNLVTASSLNSTTDVGEIMSLIELYKCYVKFTPLTYINSF
jgi:hypothetical protein